MFLDKIYKGFKTKYCDECDIRVWVSHYQQDPSQPAMRIYDAYTGKLLLTASVRLENAKLNKGQMLVKTWSENEGILKALFDTGIATPTGEAAVAGFCTAGIVNLDPEIIETIDALKG